MTWACGIPSQTNVDGDPLTISLPHVFAFEQAAVLIAASWLPRISEHLSYLRSSSSWQVHRTRSSKLARHPSKLLTNAMLALQAIQRRQALFNLYQSLWIGLQVDRQQQHRLPCFANHLRRITTTAGMPGQSLIRRVCKIASQRSSQLLTLPF